MWLDDDLLYNTKRTINLFNEMVKQNVDITWDASNGVIASSVTDEIMSAAEESGCLGVVIGMESGNPEIVDDMFPNYVILCVVRYILRQGVLHMDSQWYSHQI